MERKDRVRGKTTRKEERYHGQKWSLCVAENSGNISQSYQEARRMCV